MLKRLIREGVISCYGSVISGEVLLVDGGYCWMMRLLFLATLSFGIMREWVSAIYGVLLGFNWMLELVSCSDIG